MKLLCKLHVPEKRRVSHTVELSKQVVLLGDWSSAPKDSMASIFDHTNGRFLPVSLSTCCVGWRPTCM